MLSKIKMETVLGVIMIIAMALLATKGVDEVAAVTAMAADQSVQKVIAVDAGHGGDDPGKIGINSALEKDINLAIAKKLQQHLEAEGVTVVMIREDENGLYDKSASNKKQDDMRKRCDKIDQSNAVFTVSIHQNSYTEESVHGPQVFYYTHSDEGAVIARNIQDTLNEQLEIDRPREIKANDTYYLLKRTKTPTLIVESNVILGTNRRVTCCKQEIFDLSLFHFRQVFNTWIR